MSGIAPVLARIASIESRFGPSNPVANQPLGVSPSTDGSPTSAPPGMPTAPFGDALSAAEAALSPRPGPVDQFAQPRATLSARPGMFPTATVGTAPSTAIAGNGGAGVPPGIPFAREFAAASSQHGVPGDLLSAVGWVESRYDVNALSPDGAIGIMQIMPGTAGDLGVDPSIPADAIDGAARLLRSHYDRFGSWDLSLAAYFSGAGAVANAGNQAPPRGAAYAQRVMQRMETQ